MCNGSAALDRLLSQLRSLVSARRRTTGGSNNTARAVAAAATASAVAAFYLAAVFRQGRRPEVLCKRNGHNVRVLRALAGLVDRPYFPSWLTPNGHVNCLLGYAKRGIAVSKTRELVRCWGKLDGDEVRERVRSEAAGEGGGGGLGPCCALLCAFLCNKCMCAESGGLSAKSRSHEQLVQQCCLKQLNFETFDGG